MKTMSALSATEIAPRTEQSSRKVADEESEKRGMDFAQVLQKRERPGKRAPAVEEKTTTDKMAASGARDVKGETTPSLTDPEVSTLIAGAEKMPGLSASRRERHAERKGEDSLANPGMPVESIDPALAAPLFRQVAMAATTQAGNAEGNVAPVVNGRLPLSAEIRPETDDAADVLDTVDATGDKAEPSLPEEPRKGDMEIVPGKGRLRNARKMPIEPAGNEERMPVKVVSVSTERHLEPVGTTAPGGRDGMWRGAAAQVLRALDEGLVPQALAGLDGARGGGPKVIRNLEIQLHPASLGTVTARLTITGGNLEITISVPDRRLADQMERGLDQLVRRLRARDHGSGRTVIHLVTEPQNQILDRFQQQLPGQPAADGRPSPGAQAREDAPGGGHGGQGGHGGAQAHDGRGRGHENTQDAESVRRAARRGGLLYL